MSHRNARLNVHGRLLLVERVRVEGWAVAHAAKAQGVSRQCAHRWVARYDAEGEAGLRDRSSWPHRMPTKTPAERRAAGGGVRRRERRGQDWLGPELGLPPRTVSRILRRHQVPRLCVCDPMTGEVIRASKTTAVRHERDRPGELVHVDVKKIGKIPDGGGWRAHGRQMGKTGAQKRARIGYDYVHSMVDDHSRLAYSEILADEKGATCAAFLARAAAYFADLRHRPDRAGDDRQPLELQTRTTSATPSSTWAPDTCSSSRTAPGRTARSSGSTGPCRPSGPTARSSSATTDRADALAPWLEHYNTRRRHTALGGLPRPAACHQPDGRVHLACLAL